MGTAAELHRIVARVHDPDLAAVALAEERERARFLGFRLSGLLDVHVAVTANLAGDQSLNLVESAPG